MSDDALEDQPAARAWQLAPVSPFVVARMSWKAVDRQDPSIEMIGESWAGWMASFPKDWSGVVEGIEKLAPEGASVEWSIARGPNDFSDFLAPRLPPGANAPWLDSQETLYPDLHSPRVFLLDATWVMTSDIPREWSHDWFNDMTRVAIEERMAMFEAALPKLGFEAIEPLGLRSTMSGDDYWTNIATERWPGWVARREDEELRRHVGPAKPSGRVAL